MSVSIPAPETRRAADLRREVLLVDAVTVGASAALFLAGARPLGGFLGWDHPWAIAAIGAAFVPWAVWLGRAARRRPIPDGALRVPVVVNAVWVAASAAVLLTGTPDLSSGGRWFVAAQAVAVGLLAAAQAAALRRWR